MMKFKYTNHRGETAIRKVVPIGVEYLPAPGYGYSPGWFLRAYDTEKKADRSFALVNITEPERSPNVTFNF